MILAREELEQIFSPDEPRSCRRMLASPLDELVEQSILLPHCRRGKVAPGRLRQASALSRRM